MQHLLFLCDYFPPNIGGIEVVNKALATAFSEDMHVTVLCRQTPGLPKETMKENLRILRIDSPTRALHPLFAWWTALKVAKTADVVHVSPYASAYLAGMLRLFVRAPFLLHVHGFLGSEVTTTLYGKIFSTLVLLYERTIFTLPWQRVVCVSQSLADRLTKAKLLKNPDVIHNGLDTNLFYPQSSTYRNELGIPKDAILCTFAGRPSPLKGYTLILQALPEMLKKHPRLHIAFFVPKENAQDWQHFQKELAQFNTNERVHLYPSVPHEEMPKVYGVTDLMLIPSQSEGFCYQAVEACAMDTAVLCPRLPVFEEVTSGRTIFIKDLSVQHFLDGIDRYLRKEWEVIPQKSFSWETAIQQWRELYASLSRK